jgi:hypothetical protein
VIVRRVVAVIINSEQQKTLLKNPSRGFHFFFLKKLDPTARMGAEYFLKRNGWQQKKRSTINDMKMV